MSVSKLMTGHLTTSPTNKTPNVSHLSGWAGLIAILIVYLGLAVTFSQTMHFSRALDEGYHLEYVTFIKQYGRLPITYEERRQITRADFPPLYQLLVALLSANVSVDGPPNFKYFWDSFRYRAIDHQADQVWTLQTEDTQPPYLGRFLVWQIGRWGSIALSLATIVVVFLTLQELPLAPKPLIPLAGAALLAFIPRYITLGMALNDDNLLGLLAALYFWLLIKAIKNPLRWRPFVGIGVLLGLSMTVKYTLIVVPLEIGLVSLILAKQQRLGWPWLGQRLGTVAGLALLYSSWWFGWNIWFLNTVKQDGWIAGLLSPLLTGGSDTTLNRLGGFFSGGQIGLTELPENTRVGTFMDWLRSTFLSFWGVSNFETIPCSFFAYTAIGLMLGLAAVGVWRVWRTDPTSRQWLLLLAFHISLFVILPLVRFGLSRRLGQTAQGRHILIPAAAAIVGLIVWGLAAAIPPRWQRWGLGVVIASFVGWTGLYLYQLIAFAESPLPLRTLPQAAEWLAWPLNAEFGEAVELVSYEVDPQPALGQLRLNLAWRSLAHVKESFLLKVSLLSEAGQLVSSWIGYNGGGRLPTLAWDPGDTVFDRLVLPIGGLTPGRYTIQVQLMDSQGPLPVSQKSGGDSQSEHLVLTTVALEQPVQAVFPHALEITGQAQPVKIKFDLWGAAGPKADGLPTYRYPATISVITDRPDLELALVDQAGQSWSAAWSQANIHHFIIGPRWSNGEYRLQVKLPAANLTQTTGEPVLNVENWWSRQFEIPPIEHELKANFANQLMLLGYKLPQTSLKAGEAFPITLYWQALPDHPPQASFTQFNHLVDSAGILRGGYDRLPLEYYDTLLWAPGEVVIDGYAVPVNADAPPGQYYLNVGYYLTVGEAAVNLPLVVDGQMTDVTSVTIGPIEVIE